MNNLSSTPPITPEVMEKIVNNQEKEIILRQQELELRKQADSNNFSYANASLEANLKNLESQRKHSSQESVYRYIFSGIVVFLLISLIAIGFYLNKDQAAMEIIKVVMYVGIGAFGGYSYGKSIPKDTK